MAGKLHWAFFPSYLCLLYLLSPVHTTDHGKCLNTPIVLGSLVWIGGILLAFWPASRAISQQNAHETMRKRSLGRISHTLPSPGIPFTSPLSVKLIIWVNPAKSLDLPMSIRESYRLKFIPKYWSGSWSMRHMRNRIHFVRLCSDLCSFVYVCVLVGVWTTTVRKFAFYFSRKYHPKARQGWP